MNAFVNISATEFTLNGIKYWKNFLSQVHGDRVIVYNCYDVRNVLVDSTDFSEFTVGGASFASAALLQAALLPVLYTRAFTGGGGGSGIESVGAGDNITIDFTNPAIPVISSTGGGAIDQDNIFRLKKTDYVPAVTAPNLAAVVNACPMFTIGEKELFIFFAVWIDDSLFEPVAREIKFILRDLGKGTYGVGGAITVASANIEIIYMSLPVLADFTVQPSTQIVDLGEIGATPVHEALNAENPAITIQAQADGYVIVETLVSSVVTNYLFTGAGGDYGLGEEQSTAGMFHLFGDSLVDPFEGIPLLGTTTGSPVTGNLLFNEPFGIKYKGADYPDNYHGVYGGEGAVELYGKNDVSGAYASLAVSGTGIGVNQTVDGSNVGSSRGLTSTFDFTPNITDLDYTQKKYVDDAIAAAGGGGAVSSVNGDTGIVVLNQDDILDGTTYKQYSATEKTKLAGIATSATANDTDANLKNRANHTGTQTASTISDFSTAAKTAAVADSITNGVTDVAPSQNAVFDALALKASASDVTANTTALGFAVKRLIPRLNVSATHTGTTTDTVVQTYQIPANTIDDNAALELEIHVSKINTISGGWDVRASINDTPDLAGTPSLIARVTVASSATVQVSALRRQMNINGSTLSFRDKDVASGNDYGSANTANDTATWNRAAVKYLIIHIEMAGATQQTQVDNVSFIQK